MFRKTAQSIALLQHQHTAYFADSAQAEAVSFGSSRRERSATGVQPSVDVNSG